VIFNNTNSEEWVGKTALFDLDGQYVFSNHMTRLRLDEGVADPEFISKYLHFLWSVGYSRQKAKRWVSQAAIDQNALLNFNIPLPTLTEQRRITSVLRKYDELIDTKAGFVNSLTKDVVDGYAYESVGNIFVNDKNWPVKRIEQLANVVRGSSPRPQGDARYFGGPVPRLMVADVTRDGLYVEAKIDSLTEEGAKRSRWMEAGSVVIAVSGSPGLSAILKHGACIHDGFAGLRELSNDVLPEYLVFLLNAFRARSDQQAVGAIFRNLTTDQLKEITVPIPPLDVQEDFKKFVVEVYSVVDAAKKSDGELRGMGIDLKAAAFSGELSTTWRSNRSLALLEETKEPARIDSLVKSRVQITEHAPAEREIKHYRPERAWLVEQLSEFQNNVRWALHEWKGTLIPDDSEALDQFCKQWPIEDSSERRDHVRRALGQLSALGLIAKISLKQMSGDGTLAFVTAFRPLREEEVNPPKDIERLGPIVRSKGGA
jgi:type I restriction enzyme, S subunit